MWKNCLKPSVDSECLDGAAVQVEYFWCSVVYRLDTVARTPRDPAALADTQKGQNYIFFFMR